MSTFCWWAAGAGSGSSSSALCTYQGEGGQVVGEKKKIEFFSFLILVFVLPTIQSSSSRRTTTMWHGASKVVVRLQTLSSHTRLLKDPRSFANVGINRPPNHSTRSPTATISTDSAPQPQQPSTVRPSVTWKMKTMRERSGSTMASAIAHEPVVMTKWRFKTLMGTSWRM